MYYGVDKSSNYFAHKAKRVNEMMKAKHSDEDGEVLEHHGIRGQKWGVRRFQNKDGTLTPAGRAREGGSSSDNAQNAGSKKGISKDTIKKAAIIGTSIAVGAALIAHPTTRNIIAKYGKTTLANLKDVDKAKALGTKIGTSIGKRAANGVDKANETIRDAVLASVSGIAISKIADKLSTNENDSEFKKTKNKVILDAASAGIKAATGSSGNGNNKGNSNVKVDKSSKEYQNLFSGLNNDSDRKKIKERANEGASMEELQKLREELGHADIHEWVDSIISDSTRW